MPDTTNTTETGGADLLLTLENVLRYCNNWFRRESVEGTWTVDRGPGAVGLTDADGLAFYTADGLLFRAKNNTTVLPELADGQYFRVIGSIFNDALYRLSEDGSRTILGYSLTPETWDGVIWALAIPPAVVALAVEIQEWRGKYEDMLASPISSEDFGGYSYTKSGAAGTSTGGQTWQDIFASKLRRWRKL